MGVFSISATVNPSLVNRGMAYPGSGTHIESEAGTLESTADLSPSPLSIVFKSMKKITTKWKKIS